MRTDLLSLSILASLGLATTAARADINARFCAALADLTRHAAATHRTQAIKVFAGDELEFACGHGHDRAGKRFCLAAFEIVGPEFKDLFPWRVHRCLIDAGFRPVIEAIDAPDRLNGRKQIIYLSAPLKAGMRIEIRYVPAGGKSGRAQPRYDLTIGKRRSVFGVKKGDEE